MLKLQSAVYLQIIYSGICLLSESVVSLHTEFNIVKHMRKINRTIDEKYKACPIRNVIEKFGDKWSLLVLYHLNERGTMRFNDLGRDMSDCSQKMLSQTLKRLEQIGLVARQVYPEVPPRVEYSITELGKSLMPHVIGLMEWATQNFENLVGNEGC